MTAPSTMSILDRWVERDLRDVSRPLQAWLAVLRRPRLIVILLACLTITTGGWYSIAIPILGHARADEYNFVLPLVGTSIFESMLMGCLRRKQARELICQSNELSVDRGQA